LDTVEPLVGRTPDAAPLTFETAGTHRVPRHGSLIYHIELGAWYGGEALYWRAWNRLQLADLDLAHEDADAGEENAELRSSLTGRGHKRFSPLAQHEEDTNMKPKNTICLWFNKDAQEAARFYAATFPNSEVTAVHEAPGDYPGGKKGDVLTVEFTVLGIPCLGLNGGPNFKHSEAFSFQIATDNQEETDRYWNAIVGNGGQESQCGWCKDRWGLSWQITPRVLTEALAAGGGKAKRAFEAMMPMKKIDIATIEAAQRS
jgi:predicted 3-demethylubiquinone-9 3-methyltransferase (glyoxalase superfamily)